MLGRVRGRGTHVCTGWRWKSKHSTAPEKQNVTGTAEGRRLGRGGGHLTKSLRSGETTVYHPNWDPFRVTFCTWGNEHGDGPGQARHMATPLTRPASRVTHSGPGEVPAEVCAEDRHAQICASRQSLRAPRGQLCTGAETKTTRAKKTLSEKCGKEMAPAHCRGVFFPISGPQNRKPKITR